MKQRTVDIDAVIADESLRAYAQTKLERCVPGSVKPGGGHLLEYIEPEVWHWETEGVKFSRAGGRSLHRHDSRGRLGVLKKDALVMDEKGVVIPLYGIGQTV